MTPSVRRAIRRRRPLPWVLAAATTSVLAGGAALGMTPANAVAPPPPSGFTTVWSEDFTGPAGAGLDTATWRYDLGTGYPGGAPQWGTGEIEVMTASTANVATDGAGHLAITPLRDASGTWTSGRIETQRTDFAAPVGGVLRVEAAIQQPDVTTANGAGYWPAFWMLGEASRAANATNWPSIGEIDILEDVNGRSSEFATLHCGLVSGGPCNETTGIGSGEQPCPGCQTSFHTYAMELDRSVSPERIRYYLDGTNFFTVTADQVDATTWDNATHHGFFLILNVALGGGFPAAFGAAQPTAATVSGKPMLVDYVTVSTRGGGSTPSTGRDAYATIEAESADAQFGTDTETTTDVGGGRNVGWIGTGDWLAFNTVDFGSTPARQFQARVASAAPDGVSGLVEVRLDSRTSPPIGSFAVGNTGGWQSWRTVPGNLSAVTGTHTVYLTFTSGQPADYLNLNWISFAH